MAAFGMRVEAVQPRTLRAELAHALRRILAPKRDVDPPKTPKTWPNHTSLGMSKVVLALFQP